MKNDYSISVLRKRLFAIIIAVTFLLFIVLARLFYVQVIWSEELGYRALDQWTREIPIVAKRGNIKVTDGTFYENAVGAAGVAFYNVTGFEKLSFTSLMGGNMYYGAYEFYDSQETPLNVPAPTFTSAGQTTTKQVTINNLQVPQGAVKIGICVADETDIQLEWL